MALILLLVLLVLLLQQKRLAIVMGTFIVPASITELVFGRPLRKNLFDKNQTKGE